VKKKECKSVKKKERESVKKKEREQSQSAERKRRKARICTFSAPHSGKTGFRAQSSSAGGKQGS
jgi:hypothetical protein